MVDKTVVNFVVYGSYGWQVSEATDANGKALSLEEINETIMLLHPPSYAKPSFLEEGVDFDHWVELDEDWEQQLPDWFNELVDVYVDAMRTAKMVAHVASQEESEGLIKADYEFTATQRWVLEALDDSPSPAMQKCLEMLMRRAGWDLHTAVRGALSAWKREYKASQEGIKHGHAAYGEHSWLVELDRRPEWMEHKVKANGKVDWKISDRIILKELNNFRDVILPGSHTTIGRERNKRRLTLK